MKLVAIAIALASCGGGASHQHVRYPIHPVTRSAAGGPIEIVGGVARPGVIPYAIGMTLRGALRLAGGTTATSADAARLQRFDGRHYDLPLRAIIDGSAPDLELAPGDHIVVFTLETEPVVDE